MNDPQKNTAHKNDFVELFMFSHVHKYQISNEINLLMQRTHEPQFIFFLALKDYFLDPSEVYN